MVETECQIKVNDEVKSTRSPWAMHTCRRGLGSPLEKLPSGCMGDMPTKDVHASSVMNAVRVKSRDRAFSTVRTVLYHASLQRAVPKYCIWTPSVTMI